MQNSIVKKSLVIGIIFLFIGVGILPTSVVATINKQTNPEPAKIIEIEVSTMLSILPGYSGVWIHLEVGPEPHIGGTFVLTINAPIMIIGQKHIIKIDWLPAHQPIAIPFGYSIGFGRCSIQVTFDVDDDGEPDTEGTCQGFIFGPFVLFHKFYVPIP